MDRQELLNSFTEDFLANRSPTARLRELVKNRVIGAKEAANLVQKAKEGAENSLRIKEEIRIVHEQLREVQEQLQEGAQL